jgi:hypothetical protein
VEAWLRANLIQPAGIESPPLALMLAAMWGLLDDPSFPQLALVLLRVGFSYPWTIGEEPTDDKRRKRRKVAALVAPGFESGEAARGALSLLEAVSAGAATAESRLQEIEAAAKDVKEINQGLVRRLEEQRAQAESLQMELDDSRAAADDLRTRLSSLERHSAQKVAQASTERVSDVGRIRTRVRRILSSELEELRHYLERPEPNVRDALLALQNLEALRDELGEADGQ